MNVTIKYITDSRSNRDTKVYYFVEKKSKFAFINGTPTGFAVL